MSIQKYLDYTLNDAVAYDQTIDALVPPYQDMLDTMAKLAGQLNWPGKEIIEYGPGTGNLTGRLLRRVPRGVVRGYDISPAMLEVCRSKLGGASGVALECRDITFLDGVEKAGLIAASLVIHELAPLQRLEILKRAKGALLTGGWLIVGDVYGLTSEAAQAVAQSLWLNHMREAGVPEAEAQAETRVHLVEDKLATIRDQINCLRELGFNDVHVPWQHFNFHIVIVRV